MCVSPYIAETKDGRKVPVPCGKCIECRRDYQNEWTFRLSQEIKRCKIPVFITLTYNDEHLPLGDVGDEPQSVLVKSDLQKFFKRMRKNGGELVKDSRYFAIGEYGSKHNRAHYHIVWMSPNVRQVSEIDKLVDKCWRDNNGDSIGFSYSKFCTDKQVHYVSKYMNKLDDRPHLVKPFRLYSRSIGLNYLTQQVINYYLTSFDRTCLNGKCRISLPRYYRRKLDALSEQNYFLKKAGLKYTDLLEEVRVSPDSQYYYFKYFTEHYEEIERNVQKDIAHRSRLYGYQYYQPTRQEVWKVFADGNELLRKLLIESDRKIKQCQIKNRLTGLQPITPEILEDI